MADAVVEAAALVGGSPDAAEVPYVGEGHWHYAGDAMAHLAHWVVENMALAPWRDGAEDVLAVHLWGTGPGETRAAAVKRLRDRLAAVGSVEDAKDRASASALRPGAGPTQYRDYVTELRPPPSLTFSWFAMQAREQAHEQALASFASPRRWIWLAGQGYTPGPGISHIQYVWVCLMRRWLLEAEQRSLSPSSH